MNPDDIPKTAITTPFGTFTFDYSCFGLKISGATFQRLMDSVLGDLPFCVVYIDDILIFSSSVNDHDHHLRIVLGRLKDNGLVINKNKVVLAATEVEFLGHLLSPKGVSPLQERVQAITTYPQPASTKALQRFLGMVTFYHRLLKNIASTLAPLTAMTKGRKKKKLCWSDESHQAFEKSKASFASNTLLSFPSPRAELVLSTDANDTAIGAVLKQLANGHLSPVAFYSKKLSPAQTRYSTFDRELLAIVQSLRKFRHLLEASSFTIRTDHMPLIYAVYKKSDIVSDRQRRHLAFLSEFNCKFVHVKGNDNAVADALSRVHISAVYAGWDLHNLRECQLQDTVEIPHASSVKLQWTPCGPDMIEILCDISTSPASPCIPSPLRCQAFEMVHSLVHPSICTKTKLMNHKFV